jgi:hypothetical protein
MNRYVCSDNDNPGHSKEYKEKDVLEAAVDYALERWMNHAVHETMVVRVHSPEGRIQNGQGVLGDLLVSVKVQKIVRLNATALKHRFEKASESP